MIVWWRLPPERADILCTTASVHGPICAARLQAKTRLEANGENKLSPPPERPEWLKYLLQYTNPLLFLLIIAATLTFIAYAIQDPKDNSNIILGVVLFLTIFLLATTQYMNERAAGSVAAQLKNLLPSNAQVIRDGKEMSINATELVVGDYLHMTIGSRVPADVKVHVSKDLKLDFSSLTGAPFSSLIAVLGCCAQPVCRCKRSAPTPTALSRCDVLGIGGAAGF